MIPIAHAAVTAEVAAQCLVYKFNQVIFFPLIGLLMAIAFLVFLWGAFEFVKNSDNEAGRETGRTHLLYGTIGMLIMLSAYAILNIAAGTFGLNIGGNDLSGEEACSYMESGEGGTPVTGDPSTGGTPVTGDPATGGWPVNAQ